jgi:precorrin-2/cobalt-factor-2 C20-methyltransferase
MSTGTLYGIGVGPGDPEWITVKAARILGACRHVAVPKSRGGVGVPPARHPAILAGSDVDGTAGVPHIAAENAGGTPTPLIALEIARPYLRPGAVIHAIAFPMTTDAEVLTRSWAAAAQEVHAILAGGEDCCFLTLGDALLYSTYIYLLEAIRRLDGQVTVVTVPGITAFSAAAALTGVPIGQGKQPVTIVPAGDDLAALGRALDVGGTVIVMKVGNRLERVLDELDRRGLIGRAVFVSRAGMADQHVETDLRRLRGAPERTGYLSILIIQAGGEVKP